ncbi:FtsX-like permease family protein [Brevifollis gellanilyticus]|uniref:ABC transporter permease n=1 Tax=Brevifollis gellanilyticus TaxID=748831 RepID=A0A512MEY5_9BACT|nr:FtsX-like permease family protein [Brevifollis gellanilyticus]GEP45278.1 ABC transporter permease [Brevifollis gellanilyticus]
MTLSRFVLSSARHYWRGHLGLLLGAFLASAILSGSLLVGDSVRASLRRVAELRLGKVQSGLLGGDRWFTADLAKKAGSEPVIIAVGSTANANGKVRVNGTQVLGVDAGFWKLSTSGTPRTFGRGEVLVNEPLARKLSIKGGDTVIVRLERPSAISRDAPLSGSTNQDVSLRRQVAGIVSPEDFGAFQLIASQITPDTVFVGLEDLQNQIEMDGKVNAALSSQFSVPGSQLEQGKTLDDLGLKLTRVAGSQKEWEVSTSRVFMDHSLASKLLKREGSYGVLTYLVNGLKSAKGGTPYSMITAVDRIGGSAESGITISQWLAEDQSLAIGDEVEVFYFVVGLGRELKQESAKFKVRGILPMTDPEVTRAWTPEFPGVSDVDNCRDWEPGIPMDMKAIRDKDEKYWDDYKATPKGFISLAEGQKLWANRFGNLTGIRFADTGQDEAALKSELLATLQLADIGLTPRDFKKDADAAAKGSVDFGGLFIGLSMFLIAAALVFAALLFLFTLERRASQVGLLLALGWTTKQVRRALLGEAGVIAIIGSIVGLAGGVFYTKAALAGLSGAWSGASQGLPLIYSASIGTQIGAAVGSILIVLLTLWWASRKMFRAQTRDLLTGETDRALTSAPTVGKRRTIISVSLVVLAIGLVFGAKSAKAPEAVAGMFFGSGMMLMIAGLRLAGDWMRRDRGALAQTLTQIGRRNISRRPSRSLAVIGMMAGGIFLVTAVNAFRMSAGDVTKRDSGTGGFALIGESSLPIYEDLNTKAGIEAFGLDEELMKGVKIVPFRVREGDDASCLNLNRAQKPVLVGVNPALLDSRFRFAGGEGWNALSPTEHNEPGTRNPQAIADQATAMWGLGKGVGGTVDYQNAAGETFGMQISGLVGGSVLQGKMITSEAAFLKAYPDASGYRFFLIDAPADKVNEVSAHLTRQLEQRGLALEPAKQRLEAFLAVQNTYIGIFTILGGLGVLLGTAGLGVLVARHVLERRGELGLMQALGFMPAALRKLVLGEHVFLLIAGLLLGVVCALIAVWPSVSQGGGDLPVCFLGALLGGVLIFGLLTCWLAVTGAVRGRLLEAIRRE